MIMRNGHFQCPVCERPSPYPLSKNMELIHILEFLQLQLDIPPSKQVVSINSNEISISKELSDILLEEENILLTNAVLRGNKVVMKKCAYSDETLYSKEIALLKDLYHPNLMQLLAHVHTLPSEGGCHGDCSEGDSHQSLIYECAPNGKLSTYLSCSKSASSIHSLLTKERRLTIAIDIVQAVLYLQSQGSAINLIADNLSRMIESHYVLLDENYTAKLMMVMTPHKTAASNGSRLPVNSEANKTNMSTEELLLYDHHDSEDNKVIKALGYLLLELLLNKEQEGRDHTSSLYPDLISKPLTSAEFFEVIEAAGLGHPSLQQFCTEGVNGGVHEAFELFVEPLYRLAMACVDIHQHNICSMSTRQLLFQLRHIRKCFVTALTPPVPVPAPVKEESKSAKRTATKPPKTNNNHNMTRKEKKASAATKKTVLAASSSHFPPNKQCGGSEKEGKVGLTQELSKLKKSRKSASSISTASSIAVLQTPSSLSPEDEVVEVVHDPSSAKNNKKVRKKSHHPGYYYNKTSTRPSDGVEVPASWRCCGKTSAKAMGCVYGPISHHTGKWICAIEPKSLDVDNNHEKDEKKSARRRKSMSPEANDDNNSSTVSMKWGRFECCSVDTDNGENKIDSLEQDHVVGQSQPLSSYAGCQQGPQPKPFRGGKSPHL